MKALTLSVKSKTESVREILKQLEGFCKKNNLNQKIIETLQVATDEAITNIILHSYEGRTDGTINVHFLIDNNRIIIELTDFGKNFEPETLMKKPIKVAQEKVGGYGLVLMNALMDNIQFSYNKNEKANCLKMEKIIY